MASSIAFAEALRVEMRRILPPDATCQTVWPSRTTFEATATVPSFDFAGFLAAMFIPLRTQCEVRRWRTYHNIVMDAT